MVAGAWFTWLSRVVVLVSVASSCSPLIPVPDPTCNTDADCNTQKFCDNGVCRDLSNKPRCSSHKECQASLGTPLAICRKPGRECVLLTSQDCTTVMAEPEDLQNDHAIILGSLLPTQGPDQSTGLPMQHSIELARRDFKQTMGGLPPAAPGEPRRPLVIVGCNDSGDALRAAKHLTHTVGVPAIIGASFSGVTLDVAQRVTIPGNVLLMSPSATSPLLSDVMDHGLVWRTSPPDTLQAVAINAVIGMLEQTLRTGLWLEGEGLRVVVAHKGDGYGMGLSTALQDVLTINGLSVAERENRNQFAVSNYGDPDDPSNTTPQVGYQATVTRVLALQPHVVVLAGTAEAVTEVLSGIEAAWSAFHRPYYVLSDGCQIPELLHLMDVDPNLRNRVLGTVPGTVGANFGAFLDTFHANPLLTTGTNPEVFGTAGCYDAVYLLAYAVVALRDSALNGPNLAGALKKLVPPGPVVNVGPSGMHTAFTVLTDRAENNIDFNGASGPLDFDVNKGEAESDVQVWRVVPDDQGNASTFQYTGWFYDASTRSMQGSLVW